MTLGHAAAPGEVADHAMFRRHGKKIAARLKHRPFPAGREGRGLQQAGDVFQPGPQRGAVGGNGDFHLPVLLRFEVQQIQPPGVLKHDVLRADTGEMHVIIREERDLPEFPLLNVGRPEVEAFVRVPIGQEIERAAMPHRNGFGRLGLREVAGLEGGEIEQPEIGIHTAPITFPSAEIHADGIVGDGLAVRRNRAELAVGHGQFLGQAPLRRHFVKLVEAVLVTGHGRGVEDVPSVRVPAHHPVGRAVVGEALG
ncbi:MAG: hypothetical protein BWX84_00419 [Verrucomicrobia bacterium ADurb.Bin118]|nr:MAG: hypothetical protein BWX84_00419 [Verrucomicrobia bacterium ADurb.Bin118]